MSLLITLCARGGSKGIPGKNIRSVNGQPLIAYSIRHAEQYAKIAEGDIALSTDSEEIRTIAAEHGLVSDYVRPAALATDGAGKIPVLRDILDHEEQKNGKRYNILLDLDVTSPLRTLADLEEGCAILQDHPEALNLFSVNPARRSPYFNMVERGADGYAHLCKKPESTVLSRQNAPQVYEMNASFYFYRRAFFETGSTSAITDRSLLYEMPHRCFDLDTPEDFAFMEFLVKTGQLGFPFLS